MDPSQSSAPKKQLLGKRNHGGQPIMRVPNQFRNTGGSSTPIFHQKPSAGEISMDLTNVAYHTPNSTPPPSGPTKQVTISDYSFVMNTVDSMKENPRPRLKRVATNSTTISETPSTHWVYAPAKPLKPPRLRPSRPVQNSEQVYADIWIRIFSFCDPKFLLEAKTINKHFNRILSEHSSIWKECRLNYYGADMPSLPDGLTEKQYVELLAGRGCQYSRCSKGETLKVDEISLLRRYTLPETQYEIDPDQGLSLWELLPLVRLDGRDWHAVKIDQTTNNWAGQQGSSRQFRFLKHSYNKTEAEFQQLEKSGASETEVKAWADAKHAETMKLVAKASELEAWCKKHIYNKQMNDAQDLKHARIDFFVARARELSPPMQESVLWKMADFRKILKVRAQPTQRSWDALRQKIEPFRQHAERVLEYERAMNTYLPHPSPQIGLYKQLHEHRWGRKQPQPTYQPEQLFVLRLGQAEFARCLANAVADEDLLLLCLKNVFDTYSALERLPIGLSFDGTTGPYRLSLDDAKMIVEDVMEKAIPPLSPRGRAVFQSLRCRGCRRSDHITTYTFVDAFYHIRMRHATEVGEGLEFYHFAQPFPLGLSSWLSADQNPVELYNVRFPWYTMFWPRSLPLVPRHREPSKMEDWHPAVPTEFVQLEKPLDISAFQGRQPCSSGNPDDAFALNLIYAATKLYGIDLDGPCQLKIALRFALDLYARVHEAEPLVSVFVGCLDELRVINTKIDLKFSCGICLAEDKVDLVSRRSKYRKYLEQLEKHWTNKHHGGPISWTEGLMQLPTENQVFQQILSSDKKLKAEQAALRDRESTRAKDIKKRAVLKASVILQQRAAGDVFDELFPRCV